MKEPQEEPQIEDPEPAVPPLDDPQLPDYYEPDPGQVRDPDSSKKV